MARIRTVKPEFWPDEKLGALSPITRLVFLGLISHADDAGRLVDSVKLIDGLIFPYTEDTCRESLVELEACGRIVRYRSESKQPLLQIVNWTKHQKVSHSSSYTLPGPYTNGHLPETLAKVSGEPPEDVPNNSSSDQGSSTYDLRPTTYDQKNARGAPEPEFVSANQIVGAWIRIQPERPADVDIEKQAAVAKRLARRPRDALMRAFVGIGQMFPHSKGEPWDLFDLEKKFTKAVAAAQNHPEIKSARFVKEFNQALDNGTWLSTGQNSPESGST